MASRLGLIIDIAATGQNVLKRVGSQLRETIDSAIGRAPTGGITSISKQFADTAKEARVAVPHISMVADKITELSRRKPATTLGVEYKLLKQEVDKLIPSMQTLIKTNAVMRGAIGGGRQGFVGQVKGGIPTVERWLNLTDKMSYVLGQYAPIAQLATQKKQQDALFARAANRANLELAKTYLGLNRATQVSIQGLDQLGKATYALIGIAELRHRIGQTISQVGEGFKANAANMQNATDAGKLYKASLEAVASSMEKMGATTARITPAALNKMAYEIAALLPQLEGLGKQGLGAAANTMQLGTATQANATRTEAFRKSLQGTIRTILEHSQALDESTRAAVTSTKATSDLSGAVGNSARGFRYIKNQIWETVARLRPMSSVMQGLILSMNALQGNIRGLLYSFAFLGFSIPKIALVTAALAITVGGLTKAFLGLSKAIRDTGTTVEEAINKLRGLSTNLAEAGKMFVYAQMKAIKYGTTLDDLTKSMDILTKAGLGSNEVVDTMGVLATALGVKVEEASRIFTGAVGAESASLKSLHRIGIHVNKSMVDTTNRTAVAQFIQMKIMQRYGKVYEDVSQSTTFSLRRIRESLLATTRIMLYPIWKQFFGPLLVKLANFATTLVTLARALWASEDVLSHWRGTLKLMDDTLKEFAPEIQMLADIIRKSVVAALWLFLKFMRLCVHGLRWMLGLVRSLGKVFAWFGRLLKPISDMLRKLIPKELLDAFRNAWVSIKGFILNIGPAIKKWWNETVKPALKEFFEENPIGIFLAFVWNFLKGLVQSLWNSASEWLNSPETKAWMEEHPVLTSIAITATAIATIAGLWWAVQSAITLAKAGLEWSLKLASGTFHLIMRAAHFVIYAAGVAIKAAIIGAIGAAIVLGVVHVLINAFAPKKMQETWNKFVEEEIWAWIDEHPIETVLSLILLRIAMSYPIALTANLLTSIKDALIAAFAGTPVLLKAPVALLALVLTLEAALTIYATIRFALDEDYREALKSDFADTWEKVKEAWNEFLSEITPANLLKIPIAFIWEFPLGVLPTLAVRQILGLAKVEDGIESSLSSDLDASSWGEGLMNAYEKGVKAGYAEQSLYPVLTGIRDDIIGLFTTALDSNAWGVNLMSELQAGIETNLESLLTSLEEVGKKIRKALLKGIGDIVIKAKIDTTGEVIPITPMQRGGSGIVRKPTLFLAGERGAEAFTFSPLQNTRAAGQEVNVFVTGNTIVGAGGIREVADLVSVELMRKLRRRHAVSGVR